MKKVNFRQAYLDLANDLFKNKISEHDLPQQTIKLPPLNETLLNQLAQAADDADLVEPRLAWAIALVAQNTTLSQHCDSLQRSEALWYLGHAYNQLVQPKLARIAILKARKGFKKLNNIGWMAACDWQLNALPWTKVDFTRTAKTLKRVLAVLEDTGFDRFAPHCRFTLAYAEILIGAYKNAEENIRVCELIFSARNDIINQARCWMNEATLLRRQNRFKEAFVKLERAGKVFKKRHAIIDLAKTYQRTAFCYFLSATNYRKAEEYFEKASKVFIKYDLELFYAECLNGLGQINIINGNLLKATDQLQKGRELFIKYEISGLTADNYNDSGQLELLKGNPLDSLEHFKNAVNLYYRIKRSWSAAVALANQGDAYVQIGRFQDALQCLELARKKFQKFNNLSSLAGCEFFLSKIWTELNQYKIAYRHLDKAEKLFDQIRQDALLVWVYNQRAKILSLDGRQNEAIGALEISLKLSQQYGTEPQVALACRQLGDILSAAGRPDDALKYISSAEVKFGEMGMVIEQAVAFVVLGDYYLQKHDILNAKAAFEKALKNTQGIMPDIEFRACTGMALVAEKQDNRTQALEYYRGAIKAALKLRDSFWQPALAGSYLQRSVYTMNKAIELAVSLHAYEDALTFIDNGKAQSFVKQMLFSNAQHSKKGKSLGLNNLRTEIQALQRQLRITNNASFIIKPAEVKDLQQRLIECVKNYDEQIGQIERQNISQPVYIERSKFNLGEFRNFANSMFGSSWAALEYYLTATKLFVVIVTPNLCQSWETDIHVREQLALEVCTRADTNTHDLSNSELKLLGAFLIPSQLKEYLTPDCYLIIAPHQALHTIPWAALQSEHFNGFLVENSIPLVVPSLEVLQLIGQRSSETYKPDLKTGLLFGLTNFKEIRNELPLVRPEIETIGQKADSNSVILIDTDATWDALMKLNNKSSPNDKGLSQFSFFHIASHIFKDSRTGRLTGIALYDDEIWLDQLRDLSPLPGMVTLSACNGAQSLVYTGDEHISIVSTCLLAGANIVIGSLWPVLDIVATNFMIAFYINYFAGSSPPQALAQAQRKILQYSKDLEHWASFTCIGTL